MSRFLFGQRMTRTTIQYMNELNEQRYRKFGSVARIWNNTKILCRKYKEEEKNCDFSFPVYGRLRPLRVYKTIIFRVLKIIHLLLLFVAHCLPTRRMSWFLGKFASSGFPLRWDDICCYDAPVYSAKYIFNKTVFSTFFSPCG